MRILVTGAKGFIGSHLVRRLRDEDHDVVEFYLDVADPESWEDAGEYDVCCHLAALVGTADSMRRPLDYLRSNVLGTAVLAEGLRGRVGRYVLASSSAAYDLSSIYAISKKAQEDILTLERTPLVILRLYAVYGPGQYGGQGGVVGMLAASIMEEGRATLYERGDGTRDFVYVDDVVQAFVDSLQGGTAVMDVGTAVPTTIQELERGLRVRLGGNRPIEIVQARPGDGDDAVAPYAYRRGMVPLADGLDRYAAWLTGRR